MLGEKLEPVPSQVDKQQSRSRLLCALLLPPLLLFLGRCAAAVVRFSLRRQASNTAAATTPCVEQVVSYMYALTMLVSILADIGVTRSIRYPGCTS